MQTFIPENTYSDCATVLDRQRLGKQRVECLQIMNVLATEPSERKGWRNHPAVLMWSGYEYALMQYSHDICNEWVRRGYVDNCWVRIQSMGDGFTGTTYPEWWGTEAIHLSHQSNLVRKDYDHYSVYYPDVPNDLPYVWPVQ